MNRIKIGVRLESFDLPLRRALEEASRLGVGGVQLDGVGDLGPDQLSQTGRRELRNLLRGHNLELTALGCPLRRGLGVPEGLETRLEYIKKVMALSFDLGPRKVIVQAGQVPDDPNTPAGQLLTESLLALSQAGDRSGAVLLLETGLESGETLARFLDRFDTGSLGVNLDPANLLMNGFDSVASARVLGGRVQHVHARDARLAGASRTAQEVPLGHGDIDWMQMLGVLEEIDYRGWLVVERESGDNRRGDVAAGVAFLRRFVR
jgi:L-ribulose-5-phosphate 3-epimerase